MYAFMFTLLSPYGHFSAWILTFLKETGLVKLGYMSASVEILFPNAVAIWGGFWGNKVRLLTEEGKNRGRMSCISFWWSHSRLVIGNGYSRQCFSSITTHENHLESLYSRPVCRACLWTIWFTCVGYPGHSALWRLVKWLLCAEKLF